MRPWLIFLIFTTSSFGQIVTPIKNPKLTGDVDFNSITNKSTARTHLGLSIGSDVQAFNSDLTNFATAATWSGATDLTLNADVTLGALIVGEVEADNINSDSDIHADGVISAGTRFLGPGASRFGLANLTALNAIAPDFTGQFALTLDGVYAFGTGTSVGNWRPTMIDDGTYIRPLKPIYSTNGGLTLTQGAVKATSSGASGMHEFIVTGSTFHDNVLYIRNDTDDGAGNKGHSVIQIMHADNLRQSAFGMAPDHGTALANAAFWEVNNDPVTSDPPNIRISQFQDNGSGTFSHERVLINGADKSIKLRGYSNAAANGPEGVHISSDGRTGLGTSTLTAGAQVTVNGAVSSSQQRFHATKAGGGAQTIGATTWTDLTFGTEVTDLSGIFVSPTATFTVVGTVHFNVQAYFSSLGAGELAGLRITKNGSSIVEAFDTGVGTDNSTISLSFFTTTDGNDTFTLQAYRAAGGDIAGETHFQGWVQ